MTGVCAGVEIGGAGAVEEEGVGVSMVLNEKVVMNVRNFYTYAEERLGAVYCSLYCVQAVDCHLVGI